MREIQTDLTEYSNPDSEKYKKMVEKIAETLDLDSLIYQRLDDLVEAIGLPKEKLCTHCWDGTSYYDKATGKAQESKDPMPDVNKKL